MKSLKASADCVAAGLVVVPKDPIGCWAGDGREVGVGVETGEGDGEGPERKKKKKKEKSDSDLAAPHQSRAIASQFSTKGCFKTKNSATSSQGAPRETLRVERKRWQTRFPHKIQFGNPFSQQNIQFAYTPSTQKHIQQAASSKQ